MTATVLRADARHLPLADNTVDLVVTSPPYFGLRSYQDGGQHYAGQVGDEATPAEFVAALLDVTRECVRVLKPSGSLWVNLGDKYSGAQQQTSGRESSVSSSEYWRRTNPKTTGVKAKSLFGLPWRYALACIDDLGLILRAEIIWSKPNGLPESVTDRVRRSHEQWFHFTKEPRYFSAVDEVREEHLTVVGGPRRHAGAAFAATDKAGRGGDGSSHTDGHPLGKLPGSVWTIPTQPLQVPASLGVDHFAAFPMEWPRRIIRGWSPSGICTVCGEGRRPVVEKRRLFDGEPVTTGRRFLGAEKVQRTAGSGIDNNRFSTDVQVTGEACDCPTPNAPTRTAVVLDPFGGTGTTALVASALGRHGISVDLSADYCRLARWRTTDPGQRAAAMQVEKPKAELPGQADLFGEIA